MLRPLLLGVVTVGIVTVAQAEPRDEAKSQFPPGTVLNSGGRLMVVTPPNQFNSSPPFEVSNILYLNRCVGGCMVTGGDINDARRHIATYIKEGPHVVAEFENDAHQSGAAADADWAAVVQCMKEVYSPFNVQIVETPPAAGNYTEAIIAGHPTDVGLDGTILGVAPAHTSCEPNDNAMSFSFANYEGGTGLFRIYGICWTAAQESAHHYGLDHSYVFADGTSACNDPLTYRNDCGGQKFFRNQSAKCGEMQERACLCGGPQNSHAKIKNIFGPGQNIVPAPTAMITVPTMGATIGQAQVVNGMAGSKRGVARVELWLNNYKWAEVKGAKFGGGGQPNPAPYQVPIPATVPNGVIDIQLKAFDDLGELGTSSTVTVTKGAPCATAETCATGQKCEAGKCFWDAPTGVLGDECTYAQYCVSGLCQGTDELQICTQECIVGATDSCPPEYDCLPAGAQGICYPKDTGGGCCSVGSSDSVWVHVGFAGLILGLVTRRRRKR